MRLTHHRQKPVQPTLNMASMIDVVFLILIFFMCTTSFKVLENNITAMLPREGNKASTQDFFDPVRVNLVKASENSVYIYCDNQPCKSFAELKQRLIARRKIADIPVIIDGKGEIPFSFMVTALDISYQAGMSKPAFATQGATP